MSIRRESVSQQSASGPGAGRVGLVAAMLIVVALLVSSCGGEQGDASSPAENTSRSDVALAQTTTAEQTTWAQSPVEPRIDNQSRIPRYEGMVDQNSEEARAFTDFIGENNGKVVFLQVHIPEDEFDGAATDGEGSFTVFPDCGEDLAPGEEPGTSNCLGWTYTVENSKGAEDYAFYYYRGGYSLIGNFAVLAFSGTHQGVIPVALKPLDVEDVY